MAIYQGPMFDADNHFARVDAARVHGPRRADQEKALYSNVTALNERRPL